MIGTRSRSSIVAGLLFGVLLTATHSVPAYAGLIAVDENSNLFGNLKQTDTNACNVGGTVACGPTAAVNSFVFLQNRYPKIYGPNKLIPHVVGNTGYEDLIAVAEALADPNYMNCICDPMQKIFGTTFSNFVSGKTAYINHQVGVGATVFPYEETVYDLVTSTSTPPNFDFLYRELRAGEDVELLLLFHDLNGYTNPNANNDYYGGHYVTVTGLTLTDNNNNRTFDIGEPLSIDIIDPGTGKPAAFSALLDPFGFGYPFGFGFDTNYGSCNQCMITGASIYAIVAESPVLPEPPSGLLMLSGLLGIGIGRLRHRRHH